MERRLKLDRLKTRYFVWFMAVVVALGVAVAVFLYWFEAEQFEKVMVERVRVQEATLAHSGALSITDFFRERKTQLLLLAVVEAVRSGREEEGRETMRLLVHQLEEDPLADVVRVSREGEVLWVDNIGHNRNGEGVSLTDRDYFLWAKEQEKLGEVFISRPMVARGGLEKGEWVVVLATPVFWQGEFNGLVFLSFPIDGLTEKYVAPLTSSAQTKSMIVGEEGLIIAASQEELVGKKIIQETEGDQAAVVEQALVGKEGSLVTNEKVTTYTPIKIGNQVWSLWVSQSYERAASLAHPLRSLQDKRFIFGLSGTLILVLILVFGIAVAQRDGFLDGYDRGRDHYNKKKSKS